jgi:hypothetical protein
VLSRLRLDAPPLEALPPLSFTAALGARIIASLFLCVLLLLLLLCFRSLLLLLLLLMRMAAFVLCVLELDGEVYGTAKAKRRSGLILMWCVVVGYFVGVVTRSFACTQASLLSVDAVFWCGLSLPAFASYNEEKFFVNKKIVDIYRVRLGCPLSPDVCLATIHNKQHHLRFSFGSKGPRAL